MRSRKDRDPNWSPDEICQLVDLKKEQWLDE
jgi:hypothetical protein